MTNTINNVPRELLERLADEIDMAIANSQIAYDLRALLSAPSPAGVDGLETIGYATESELAQLLDPTMPTGKYVRIGLDHPTCWKEDAPCEHLVALCVLSDAQAIIDGLRGEVARLSSQKADWVDRATALGQQADQQAETIANYKSQFSELHAARNLLSRLSMAGFELGDDAAVSVIAERDQQSQRIGELEGLLRAESARVDFLDAYIVTADAPDTGKVAMLADSGTLRECIDAALSAGKEVE